MIRPAVLLAMLASPAFADFCVVPVANGKPTEEPALSNPHLLVSETVTIPGYDQLVIRSSHLRGLQTIRDGALTELGTTYPRSGLFQYRNTYRLADGTVIGFGKRPDVIYRLSPERQTFEPIAVTEDYRRAFFDQEKGTAHFLTEFTGFYDITTAGAVPSKFPNYRGVWDNDVAMPRYIPAFKGYLASNEESYWYLPENGDEWVAIGEVGDHDNAYQLKTARIVANAHDSLVHIGLGLNLLTFDTSDDTPRLLYRVEHAGGWVSANGRVLVKQNQYGRHIFGGLNTLDPRWPNFYLLDRTGPIAVPGLPENVDRSGGPLQAFRLERLDAQDTALVWVSNGWMAFDGGSLKPMNPNFAPPQYMIRKDFGGADIWYSFDELYRVDDALRFEEIALPDNDMRFDYFYSDNFEGAFLVNDLEGVLWFTADLETFESVKVPTGVQIRRMLSDLPDRQATLAFGQDGVYLIETCKGQNP